MQLLRQELQTVFFQERLHKHRASWQNAQALEHADQVLAFGGPVLPGRVVNTVLQEEQQEFLVFWVGQFVRLRVFWDEVV